MANSGVSVFVLVLGAWNAVQAQPHKPTDVTVFDFDVNDILNGKLMPVQIFSQQLAALLFSKGNTSQSASHFRQPPSEGTAVHRSDLDIAFTAMGYHRRMINEFLATDYLTHQIVKDRASASQEKFVVLKRMGAPADDSVQDTNSTEFKMGSRSLNQNSFRELLNDEGMTRYKSWLDKTTTLEDIQRQLGRNFVAPGRAKHVTLGHNRKQSVQFGSDLEDDDQNFEDGDITGYALTNTPYDNTQNGNLVLTSLSADMQPKAPLKLPAISKTGYENTYDEYGVHVPPPQSHPPTLAPAAPQTVPGKEIGLKDITDIALTTLAFLSFGMFILQVLMCITMGKEDANNMMVLPMEGIDGGDVPGGDGTEEIRRRKRSVLGHTQRLNMVNGLARKALFSIDAVLHSTGNHGSCHFWVLCEKNRFAKHQNDDQKFWIPTWSLGMSWLSSRVMITNSTTATEYVPLIQSLRAVILGLLEYSLDVVVSRNLLTMKHLQADWRLPHEDITWRRYNGRGQASSDATDRT